MMLVFKVVNINYQLIKLSMLVNIGIGSFGSRIRIKEGHILIRYRRVVLI